MFSYDISDELRKQIEILVKKDKTRAKSLYKKIKEIIAQDESSIDHYKNLRYDLRDYKRVHIFGGRFVLMFQVIKEKNHILFLKIEHHDNAYKR